MSLKEQLQVDLKEAMRSRDEIRRDTIRLVLGAIKNAEIENGRELNQSELHVVLQKEAKQRRESIEQYQAAGRAELVASEQAELDVIESYLPEMLSEDEIREQARAQIETVHATGLQDMGAVMGPLMSRLRGRVEGAQVQQIVRDLLAQEEQA